MDSFIVLLNHAFCSSFRWIIARKEITLKLFLGEKFQCGKNSFVVIGIVSGYFLFIFERSSYIFNNLANKNARPEKRIYLSVFDTKIESPRSK